jgi:hypothetical protein
MNVNVALGERNRNASLIERFVDLSIQFVNKPALIMGPIGPA